MNAQHILQIQKDYKNIVYDQGYWKSKKWPFWKYVYRMIHK